MTKEKFSLKDKRKIFDFNLKRFEQEVAQDALQETIVSFLFYSAYYNDSEKKAATERKQMFSYKELEVLNKIETLFLKIEYDDFSLEPKDYELFIKYRQEFYESSVPPQE